MTAPARPLPFSRLLVGIGGALAASGMPAFLGALRHHLGVEEIQTVLTHTAARFVAPDAIRAVTGRAPIRDWSDLDAHGPGAHLGLTGGADLLLVAPATANLVADVAGGRAGTPLTTMIVGARCPVVLCPSMNATMWDNPLVRRNVRLLRRMGVPCLDNMGGLSAADGAVEDGVSSNPISLMRQVVASLNVRRSLP